MDYMPGGDFLGLLIRDNILPESVAKWYVAEMILCIEEAHALHWIHRDIKPDNFLISASGHLKISDFGLAFDGHWSHDQSYFNNHRYSILNKLNIHMDGDTIDKKEARSITAALKTANVPNPGKDRHERKSSNVSDGERLLDWRNRHGNRSLARSVVGTSQYMAPEVVRGDSYDARCDWWSVAVILYEVGSVWIVHKPTMPLPYPILILLVLVWTYSVPCRRGWTSPDEAQYFGKQQAR